MQNADPPQITKHVSRKASRHRATRKSMETRQSILNAAAAVFAKKGYSLTKLSDIADRAGIHLTGLYYYFDSKEALVADLICYVPSRALQALQTTLASMPATATHRERIEAAIATYVDHILKDDDYVRADHRIASQISPKLRKRALSISQEINDIWRALLDDAVAAGEIRGDIDMTMLRMLMIGSMNWAVEWFRPEISPPSRLSDAFRKLFFEGALERGGTGARRSTTKKRRAQ
jgi:AcrR family transcriptional regulator